MKEIEAIYKDSLLPFPISWLLSLKHSLIPSRDLSLSRVFIRFNRGCRFPIESFIDKRIGTVPIANYGN